MRPPWDDYFQEMARNAASRATCARLAVGCVLVDARRRVLSTGYNGSVPGAPHCLDVGCLAPGGHCLRCVHAEANALLSAGDLVRLQGATAYVTHEPCLACFLLLAAAGVAQIVYAAPYRSEYPGRAELLAEVPVRLLHRAYPGPGAPPVG